MNEKLQDDVEKATGHDAAKKKMGRQVSAVEVLNLDREWTLAKDRDNFPAGMNNEFFTTWYTNRLNDLVARGYEFWFSDAGMQVFKRKEV